MYKLFRCHSLGANMMSFVRDRLCWRRNGGRLGPLRRFDWRTERSSGLWNLAFLARGAEIMALSSGRGPTLYSPHTHPTPAHSEGSWLCSQSAKNVWCKAGHDGSGEGLEQWCPLRGDSSQTGLKVSCQRFSHKSELNMRSCLCVFVVIIIWDLLVLNSPFCHSKGKQRNPPFTKAWLTYSWI